MKYLYLLISCHAYMKRQALRLHVHTFMISPRGSDEKRFRDFWTHLAAQQSFLIVFHGCRRPFCDITLGVTMRARRERHLWYDSSDTSYWRACTTACDYEAPCEEAMMTHERRIMVHNWERVYSASHACNNVTPDLPPARKRHTHSGQARAIRHLSTIVKSENPRPL